LLVDFAAVGVTVAVQGVQLIYPCLGRDQPSTTEDIPWSVDEVGTIGADSSTTGRQCLQQRFAWDSGLMEESSDVVALPVPTDVVDR
jgi:hypothetical protein